MDDVVSMDAAQMLRAARRHAGVSQRGLAALAGTSASAVAAVEAGQRQPSVALLTTLLDAAGLELGLQHRTAPACPHLDRHLRRNLVLRLYRAFGGQAHPVYDRDLAPWTQLWALARYGHVEVVGEAAAGVWTPLVARVAQVRFTPRAGVEPDAVQFLEITALELLPPSASQHGALLPVGLLSREVWVAPPDLLLICEPSGGLDVALRAAARLLHEQGSRDGGFRRPPAHRDAQPDHDDHQVRHTKAFGQRRFPALHDRRGWQLDGPVSLAQWLRRYGYPT